MPSAASFPTVMRIGNPTEPHNKFNSDTFVTVVCHALHLLPSSLLQVFLSRLALLRPWTIDSDCEYQLCQFRVDSAVIGIHLYVLLTKRRVCCSITAESGTADTDTIWTPWWLVQHAYLPSKTSAPTFARVASTEFKDVPNFLIPRAKLRTPCPSGEISPHELSRISIFCSKITTWITQSSGSHLR